MSEDEDDPPPRLIGPRFWVLMAFALICTLAGAALGLVGPRLLADPPAAEGALGKAQARG